MAQGEITYGNKSNAVPVVNREEQATAEDFQDIKDIVNANAQDIELRLKEFPFSFDNSDLVNGVLPTSFTNHELNTEFPKLTLKRPNGGFEEVTQIMVYVDEDTIQLDFGGVIDAGTWNGLITFR
jgi:hypothetical protein